MEHAWRLTFAYDGEKLNLRSVRKLVKRVPPGQAHDDKHVGRFVELRASGQGVLYRRSVEALLSDTLEYPTGDPEQPFGRAPIRRPRLIDILVPALPEARSVAIVAVGLRGGVAAAATPGVAGDGGARDLIAVELPREGEAS